MSKAIRRKPLYLRLRSALEEGIRFARGETNLRTAVMPYPPPDFTADDVLRLRRRFNLSQSELAHALNVSAKTVQSWEQGIRRPSQAALRLLQLLNERPELVCSVLGLIANGTPRKEKGSGRRKEFGSKAASRIPEQKG